MNGAHMIRRGRLVSAIAALMCAASPSSADDLARGRALYQGHEAFAAGRDATANRLPEKFSACARCHGPAGEGGREGEVIAPPLALSRLTAPRDALPAFENEAVIRAAITRGAARGGGALGAAMPRYALQSEELDALLAYLRVIGGPGDHPPGVAAKTVTLGTLLPLSGESAAIGAAILRSLRDRFDESNSRGGVHGRRIELIAIDTAANGAAAAAKELLSREPYAVVAAMWRLDESDVGEAFSRHRVAKIASLAVHEHMSSLDEWDADLLAPLAAQQEALTASLRLCRDDGPHWAIPILPPAQPISGAVWFDAPPRLQRALAEAKGPGCLALGLGAAPAVARALRAGWREHVTLPFPAALLAPPRDGGGADAWRALGLAAGRLAVELLSRSGPQLHERSLLDNLPALAGFELYPGAEARFDRTRRHAFDPGVVSIPAPAGDATPPAARATFFDNGG